ncbi:hypothetical protein HDR59_05235 [bacterium]|nr:hypothetical protein [bacterium]
MKKNKNTNKKTDNMKDAIDTIIGTILTSGMFLAAIGLLVYIYDENETLYSGTVVERIETNSGGARFLVDTDENKDTIEKVIELKNRPENFVAIANIKEGSKIQFRTFNGLQYAANIYQIDDFITKER